MVDRAARAMQDDHRVDHGDFRERRRLVHTDGPHQQRRPTGQPSMTRTHIVGASVLAAILAAMTYSHIQWTSPPFTFERAWVTPNIITRARSNAALICRYARPGSFTTSRARARRFR